MLSRGPLFRKLHDRTPKSAALRLKATELHLGKG